MRVAIVGGGPSGLMTARFLEETIPDVRITIYEASERLGGKLQTRRFDAAPALYEAGVAECYDYSAFGPDPLKSLVTALGLTPVPTHSTAVAIDGHITATDDELERAFGSGTVRAVHDLHARARAVLPTSRWARPFAPSDNDHPWARRTAAELFDEVGDRAARKYVQVAAHSDLATEPHLVNGLVGLRNVLKGVPGYGAQYSIAGGMEQLPRALASRLARTRFELGARVESLARRDDGSYRLTTRVAARRNDQQADVVVLALPYIDLLSIEMADDDLRRAFTAHVARYDAPGHYLRVSILFDRPFWRTAFTGSWLLLDAFGGCCVYDETSRLGGHHAVLGWLLAGTPALSLCNADDATLIGRALESLPGDLAREAYLSFVEGKVHRWAGGVSGQPGGFPIRDACTAHRPAAASHPGVFVVGDYLFDSTLNGVLRSARLVTHLIDSRPSARRRRPAHAAVPLVATNSALPSPRL
jgi:monoamine oxidase